MFRILLVFFFTGSMLEARCEFAFFPNSKSSKCLINCQFLDLLSQLEHQLQTAQGRQYELAKYPAAIALLKQSIVQLEPQAVRDALLYQQTLNIEASTILGSFLFVAKSENQSRRPQDELAILELLLRWEIKLKKWSEENADKSEAERQASIQQMIRELEQLQDTETNLAIEKFTRKDEENFVLEKLKIISRTQKH